MEIDGKIPPGDPLWREFNGSFENYEATVSAIAYMIDAGRAFTTWHANNWRTSDNYICGQHLGLDFDTEDERSSIGYLLNDQFIARYAALVYATPNSTPDAPRSRALFLLDQPIVQAVNYARAASAMIWSFGGHADRQCKDAARFFYGSLGSMPAPVGNILPLSVLRELITQHEAFSAMQAQPKRTTYAARTNDAKDAQALLQRLDIRRADDYGDWVTVGMALYGLGSEGLSLWEAWSSRSTKHVAGECERKWKSFDANGVTMATLGMWAKEDSPR